MKKFSTFFLMLFTLQAALPVWAAELFQTDTSQVMPQSHEEYMRAKLELIRQKNAALLTASTPYLDTPDPMRSIITDSIRLEADYILQSQFMDSSDPAFGAINNVYGSPTWVVPRENALAILALIEAAQTLGDSRYLNRALLAADYLVRIQDPSDGGWFDQYDHANPVSLSKSPTQTAEVMIALFKLGYDSSRYAAMKKGAQFLMACQDPANKTGANDGLLGGGKDSSGNFSSWRWTSDNSFAYLALKAAAGWAAAKQNTAFALQTTAAAAAVLQGINTYLYNGDSADDDYGVWKRVIDSAGNEVEPNFHEWINYAPQMLDLPALGVGRAIVGEWIHDKFQQADGSVVWDDTWHTTRKSPGFSFQAALVWYDLGQRAWADTAVVWGATSGLWQLGPDANGVAGGLVDWTEPGDQAPSWQRFIDTSFYAISAFKAGYDFSIPDPDAAQILLMRLQSDPSLLFDFNLLYGSWLPRNGKIDDRDKRKLYDLASDPAFNLDAFLIALPNAASLRRGLQTNSGTTAADFNLLFGTHLPAYGPVSAADRGVLFNTAADPTFSIEPFLGLLPKSAELYRALLGDPLRRVRFNELTGAALPNTGAPSSGDRGRLFNFVVANPVDYLIAPFRSVLIHSWNQTNQSASPRGLVESYPDDSGSADQAYTYDQAVAGMLFLNEGNYGSARKIFDFYASQWNGTGLWTVYNAQSEAGPVAEYSKIAGPAAWIALFALQYHNLTGDASALTLSTNIAKWIRGLPRRDGGVAMGASGTFWQDKFSVENNINYYALSSALAAAAATDADRQIFSAEAGMVKNWLFTQGYDSQAGLFRRGGYGDPMNALDANSWAILALGPTALKNDFGIDPDQLVSRVEAAFAVSANGVFGVNALNAAGFDFSDASNASRIGRSGLAWVEGTAQMTAVYRLMFEYYSQAVTRDAVKAAHYNNLLQHFLGQDLANGVVGPNALGYLYANRAGEQVFADNRYWSVAAGSSAAASGWVYFSHTGLNPFENFGAPAVNALTLTPDEVITPISPFLGFRMTSDEEDTLLKANLLKKKKRKII